MSYIPGGIDPKTWFKEADEKIKEVADKAKTTAITVVGGKKKKEPVDFRTMVTAEDEGEEFEDDDSLQGKIASIMHRVVETTVLAKPLKKELIYILGELFRIYSPSKHELPVVEYCVRLLRGAGFKVYTDKINNVYATRGEVEGDPLVMLNAHTDTVQRDADKDVADFVEYVWTNDAYTGNGKMLGGDDKCGIALALTLAVHTELPMKIIFTVEEEIGGHGAHAVTKNDLRGVSFFFTVDRMHGTDLISTYCGRPCAPKEFVTEFIRIAKDATGVTFKDTGGSFADTYTLSAMVPGVNLSAGYYNAHTDKDFVLVDELYDVMMSVKAAIEHRQELDAAIKRAPADWQRPKYEYGYGWGGGYATGGYKKSYYDDDYYYGYRDKGRIPPARGRGSSAFQGHGFVRDDQTRLISGRHDKKGGGEGYWYGGIHYEDDGNIIDDANIPRGEDVIYDRELDTWVDEDRGLGWDRLKHKWVNLGSLREKSQLGDVILPKTMGGKKIAEKCKIDYMKKVGLDDREKSPVAFNKGTTEFEQNMLEKYIDGGFTDEQWDNMLMVGAIDSVLHSVGINEVTRKRGQKSTSTMVGAVVESGRDLSSLYDKSPDDVATEISGFLPGSVEHSIIRDFITDVISIAELRKYVDEGQITQEMYVQAVKESNYRAMHEDYEHEEEEESIQDELLRAARGGGVGESVLVASSDENALFDYLVGGEKLYLAKWEIEDLENLRSEMYRDWQITPDDLAAVALNPAGNEEIAIGIAEVEEMLLQQAREMIEYRFYEETRPYTHPLPKKGKRGKKKKKGKKGRKQDEYQDMSIMEFQLVFSDPQYEGNIHYITKGQVASLQSWHDKESETISHDYAQELKALQAQGEDFAVAKMHASDSYYKRRKNMFRRMEDAIESMELARGEEARRVYEFKWAGVMHEFFLTEEEMIFLENLRVKMQEENPDVSESDIANEVIFVADDMMANCEVDSVFTTDPLMPPMDFGGRGAKKEVQKTIIEPEDTKTLIVNRSMRDEANSGNRSEIMEVVLRISKNGFAYEGKPHYLEKYHVQDAYLWSVMDEAWNRSVNRAMAAKDYYLKYHPGDKEGADNEYNEAFSNNFLDEVSELERRMYVLERRRNKEPTYQQVFNNATFRLTTPEAEYLARLKNRDKMTNVELGIKAQAIMNNRNGTFGA
jgi:hypothetical protein